MRAITLCIVPLLVLAAGLAQAARPGDFRREGDLKVGDKARDFTLKVLGSEKKFALSANFGKRPTVLIFGSYT